MSELLMLNSNVQLRIVIDPYHNQPYQLHQSSHSIHHIHLNAWPIWTLIIRYTIYSRSKLMILFKMKCTPWQQIKNALHGTPWQQIILFIIYINIIDHHNSIKVVNPAPLPPQCYNRRGRGPSIIILVPRPNVREHSIVRSIILYVSDNSYVRFGLGTRYSIWCCSFKTG